MKEHIYALLILILRSILYTQQAVAGNFPLECIPNILSFNHSLEDGKTNEFPIIITSDLMEGVYPHNIVFTGNVDIQHGGSHLCTDEVRLIQKYRNKTSETIRTASALRGVCYTNNQVILKGKKAWLNLNTKDANIWKGDYQLIGRQGRGTADLIKQRGVDRYTILKNGSFTSCLPDSNAWSALGREVIHDHKKKTVKIWNACFKVGPVPIFYSPYLELPIGNTRRSGFLIPNTQYRVTNSLEFYLPYYWNIKPNVDVTIIPHYIFKQKNILWESECRYLTRAGIGFMAFNYLPSEKMFSRKKHYKERNSQRWYYHWKHSGVMNRIWRFNTDYTKVSDSKYFHDFSTKYASSTENYGKKMLSVNYATRDLDIIASVRQFNVFSNQKENTYNAVPKVDIHWYLKNSSITSNVHVYGQVAHFVNSNSNMPEATRIHLEPSISIPWLSNGNSLETDIKLMITRYQQKNLYNHSNANNANLKDSIKRILPQLTVKGKLIFERPVNFLLGHTQSLEPRVQYLYIPYRNQKKINNYDSSLLQSDYSGLFRDRIYSGLDRIASTEQITTGLISRISDSSAIERFYIAIGQLYRFRMKDANEKNIDSKNKNKIPSLVWAGDSYWRIADYFGLRSSIQYDSHSTNPTVNNTSIEYRQNENNMLQLTYRYLSSKYIQKLLSVSSKEEQDNARISQVGGALSWLISDHWSIIGAHYLDTNKHKIVDQKLGLQYHSCCYAIQVGYERKLNNWDLTSKKGGYSNTIGLNFELRGLSPNHDLGIQKMLRSNILPYQTSL